MNTGLKSTLIFVAGAGVGAAASYFYSKKKFESQLESEYEAMSEYKEARKKATEANNKPDISTFASAPEKKVEKIVEEKPPVDEYVSHETEKPKKSKKTEHPTYEMIDSVEFVSFTGKDKSTIVFYKDGVISNDIDPNITYSANDTIGDDIYHDLLAMVEGQEEGAEFSPAYVRNNKLNTDFEVIFDSQTYNDVMNSTLDSEES